MKQFWCVLGLFAGVAFAGTAVAAGFPFWPPPPCPTQLTTCTGNLSTCKASLGTCTSNDATCTANLATCTGNLSTCTSNDATCTANLATCEAQLEQVTAASRPRFIDNGDGTVSDTKTGLMWEKKTTDGSLHDVSKTFTWSTGDNNFDGTAKTAFLDLLNDVAGSGAHCFAGYCDWRLPDEDGQNPPGTGPKELETILDYTQGYCGGGTGPCVFPALGPTHSFGYWSATTGPGNPGFAWDVYFVDGSVFDDGKAGPSYVRAVRSGL